MRTSILITGVCGFVGHALASRLKAASDQVEVTGIDNFIRPGSERNRAGLRRMGVRLIHGDIRQASDMETLPAVDWVIDAAANPSVLAGVDGKTSSRQLIEHNLWGTVNLLEYCKRVEAGFILLSTSRVYSIPGLSGLAVTAVDGAYQPVPEQTFPPGLSVRGVTEQYSTAAPVSLYGASKVASEALALEYGATFGFPVWVNRCGVLAGAGQFGRADQGIFAYWLNAWCRGQPLTYIGFDGMGHQVRDCLHPADLAELVRMQMEAGCDPTKPTIINVAGGLESAISLRQLSAWCADRWGGRKVMCEPQMRPFDIPWMVLDNNLAARSWEWGPKMTTAEILEEIAVHAAANPDWLEASAPL